MSVFVAKKYRQMQKNVGIVESGWKNQLQRQEAKP